MTLKKVIKTIAIIVVVGIVIGGGIGLYMYNMPHRNVQSSDVDFEVTSTEIVQEYLANPLETNNKYLADDGDSKILLVTGTVAIITEDYIGQKVILLKESGQEAGVSATFTPETSKNIAHIQVGETATIKGVIRAGATYDEDMELYEHLILEKSDIILKQ